MKEESTPWSKGAVLICTKCNKLIEEKELKESGNCGENLKTYLKGKVREARGRDIRVLTSSCLDVCEPGYQAVTYTPVSGTGGETKTWILHPEKDREELLEWIVKKG